MAKRSIKDSMNSDAAFAFVKGGFEQPPKTNLVTMSKTEQVVKPEETKPDEPPKKSKPKSEKPISKPKAAKTSIESDHLVSVSTRMRAGLFADLKKKLFSDSSQIRRRILFRTFSPKQRKSGCGRTNCRHKSCFSLCFRQFLRDYRARN